MLIYYGFIFYFFGILQLDFFGKIFLGFGRLRVGGARGVLYDWWMKIGRVNLQFPQNF